MGLAQTLLWTFAVICFCDGASFLQRFLSEDKLAENTLQWSIQDKFPDKEQAASRMKRSVSRIQELRTPVGAKFREDELILNPGCSSHITSYTALLTIMEVEMENSGIPQASLKIAADVTVTTLSGQQRKWKRIATGTYDFARRRVTLYPPENIDEYLIQECDFTARDDRSCQGRLVKRNGEVCSTYQMSRID